MIYTVTLTPALDKTVVIPDFTVDRVNRIKTIRLDPGGKGINVSKVLKALGMDSVATGILGGGTGRFILDKLGEMSIAHDFVTVPEETRTNLKVIDDVRGTHTDINEPGAPADPAVLDRVLQKLLSSVRPGDRVVLAGKGPAGAPDTLFGEWIPLLKKQGALPYLDADAALLVHGAAACPEMIKPNDEELARLTGRSFESPEEIARAALAL
ncbi:MAG: 1-phosphofructokinase, partial [Lachnospiraceae bacterium]|nr:1-phosphofructokinase [Lachnospiraceae bacterium]